MISKELQEAFTSCEVWNRISVVDEYKWEAEQRALDAGLHCAHVAWYRQRRWDSSINFRLESLDKARKLELTQF